MADMVSLEFLITSFILVATPGTGAIYTIAAGLAHGGRAGVVAAFASTLGIVPHIVAALFGLAALLHASALAFEIVKYAGVAYLLWMAWQMMRGTGALAIRPNDGPARSVRRVLADGLALNLLNPKLSIFFVAFLPQFVRPDDPAFLWRMAELSGVFMLMTFVIFAIYGLFAGALRAKVFSRPVIVQWVQRSFAGAFGLMAVKLAVTER